MPLTVQEFDPYIEMEPITTWYPEHDVLDSARVLPEGVKPVWCQSADGSHTLCDECANADLAKAAA